MALVEEPRCLVGIIGLGGARRSEVAADTRTLSSEQSVCSQARYSVQLLQGPTNCATLALTPTDVSSPTRATVAHPNATCAPSAGPHHEALDPSSGSNNQRLALRRQRDSEKFRVDVKKSIQTTWFVIPPANTRNCTPARMHALASAQRRVCHLLVKTARVSSAPHLHSAHVLIRHIPHASSARSASKQPLLHASLRSSGSTIVLRDRRQQLLPTTRGASCGGA
ncbi:hypothetical protein DFH08DRAFT_817360 [Mycena albidolilacea]|uniref:Uncharacterized protein n=1 Tax=Mycena albidolilacea TaxID=1033008 RepID=A0AAD6ZJD9_9AGAR|nr:hypothetical protein DFH08DRAFT_817360 [Mycena albidolilacea]